MRWMVQPASRSRCAVIFPRLRSKKNSGGETEDILDDVDRQAVLVCNRGELLPHAPQCHQVFDLDLGVCQDRGTPPEAGIDDDVRRLGEVAKVESLGVAIRVPLDVAQVLAKHLRKGMLAV